MTLTAENIILIGSLLMLFSVFAGKTSYRFGVPTLLLFLGVGMLAGSDGIGKIQFSDPGIAQFVGVFCLNIILFSGGLDTNFKAVKPILREGIVLSTVGVLLTALTLGTFVHAVSDFTLMESMLLGSIVSSTDAAAVFSILRSKSLALKANLRPTLELESGSNDPMAYVLTITFLSLVTQPDQEIWRVLLKFIQQMAVGAVAGFGLGYISKLIINRISLSFEGLYPVLVISLMFLTFSGTEAIGGNGFLALYICGVYLGNQALMHKKSILQIFDGLAWLAQIVLFLTLGLLVFPKQVIAVTGIGMLISLFLIFVARPVSVFISLLPFKMKMRRRWYISWVGLRGAVPIVFATYPLLAGIEQASMIFNIVFFISVTSVIIQGTTLGPVAKWLHVALPEKVKPASPTDKIILERPKTEVREIDVAELSPAANKKIVDLKIPGDSNIAIIKRENKYITPTGSTRLLAGDRLIILTNKPTELEDSNIFS